MFDWIFFFLSVSGEAFQRSDLRSLFSSLAVNVTSVLVSS